MALQSTMSTALTGMQGAETTIDVVGNNVANASTVGFKQSSVSFATQFFRTQSIGSSPSASSGGTNPRQTGLGVKVSEITPDFTPGTVEISSNPLDLAIQGDGFFIVQGSQGEQLYTRNGQFKTNSNNEIVTITGQRVLGYSVDANFQIEPTGLTPLRIPLGAAAVAQPTTEVALAGRLSPSSGEGTIPEIIQSGILSDGRKEVPDGSGISESTMGLPNVDNTDLTLAAPLGGDDVDIGTYRYRIVYTDAYGASQGAPVNESPASRHIEINVAANDQAIQIDDIPAPPSGFTHMRIYRADTTASGASAQYREVATVPAATTYRDAANNTAIAGNAVLDDSTLGNVSYSYYVTFYNSSTGSEESRPTSRIGPLTADASTAPRIRLSDLPRPSGDPATGGYDGIRIYRNTGTNDQTFHQIAEITPGQILDFDAAAQPITYVDSAPDASITSAPQINLDGPEISFVVPLIDLVSREGSNYVNLFEEGELEFTGKKGGRELGERTLTITTTTTVGELLSFMEQSMGVVEAAPESTFPAGSYGGGIAGSRLQMISNMGIENRLGIDLSAFKLTPASGIQETVPLEFDRIDGPATDGKGATVDLTVYDSLGTPLQVRVTTVLEEASSTGAKFRWIATSSDHHPDSGVSTVVGTGVITTGSDGKFVSASDNRIAIDRGDSPASSPLEFQLDFSQISGLNDSQNQANPNQLNQGESDGFPAGTLTSFIISDSGRIQGLFSNGSSQDLGQIRMATFANNSGLQQIGDNMFTTGVNSGLPSYGDPGSNGVGAVTAGAVELSNTDIGQNLIDLILASTQYRGGARVITAVQQLLDELMALRR
jgi:flagellar hook protein FlgE